MNNERWGHFRCGASSGSSRMCLGPGLSAVDAPPRSRRVDDEGSTLPQLSYHITEHTWLSDSNFGRLLMDRAMAPSMLAPNAPDAAAGAAAPALPSDCADASNGNGNAPSATGAAAGSTAATNDA